EIKRVLKPQGFFIGSFRPQYFNLLYSIQHGLWHSVAQVLAARSGNIVGGNMQFNWHTSQELLQLLQSLQLTVKQLTGIGACSGIPGDPHAPLVRPSSLSANEQQVLLQAEQNIGQM